MARKAAQKKAPAKKPAKRSKAREPETKPRDAGKQAFYDQGRDARNSCIPRRDCPLFHHQLIALWQEGWDFQDGVLS